MLYFYDFLTPIECRRVGDWHTIAGMYLRVLCFELKRVSGFDDVYEFCRIAADVQYAQADIWLDM